MRRRQRRSRLGHAGQRLPIMLAVVGLIGSFAYGWFVLLPAPEVRPAATRGAPPAAADTRSSAPPGAANPTDTVAARPGVVRSATAARPPALCDSAMEAALTNARIEFRSASTEILPASRNVLSVLAALAHVCVGEIVVAGHSDDQGPEDVNERLSLERAQAVAAAFVAFGIDPQRLTASGYGSSRPIADNSTPAGRARNRRIEMSFIASQSAEKSE